MKLVLCDKRKAILTCPGHVLVTGGPGCGKTTIALLKARDHTRTLQPGQGVLFLSFSRAAVQQIVTRSESLLSERERSMVTVQTYHSFCIELLQSHGRLLSGKDCRFLIPSEERLRKSAFNGDWEPEQQRLAVEDGVYCFDVVAQGAGDLVTRSVAVRTLLGSRFPLIIVDEFQDTDDNQWRIVEALSKVAEIVCLADPEQRIFEYRPGVDPKRVEQATASLKPVAFDLGAENHRSPTTGILAYADAVLRNQAPPPESAEVRFFRYYGNDFDALVHAAVIWTLWGLRKAGLKSPSLAILARSNALVARISDILGAEHEYDGKRLKPITHSVAWDAELSAASAVVVASLMDRSTDTRATVSRTLGLVARYYHLRNAEHPSKSAAQAAAKFEKAAELVASGKTSKVKAERVFRDGLKTAVMVGEPLRDWITARAILGATYDLVPLFGDASLVRLFGARDALANGLGDRWLATGSYRGASDLVRQLLERERLISSERPPQGCTVMNMHKAKGKEFDGVVIVEGMHSAEFFPDKEPPPYTASRRLLRVAITRARHRVTFVRPNTSGPIVG